MKYVSIYVQRFWSELICVWQFFKVQVGIQSPDGISTLRQTLRRFSDFLKLYAAVGYVISFYFIHQLSCYLLALSTREVVADGRFSA